jgi:hypothetical protein
LPIEDFKAPQAFCFYGDLAAMKRHPPERNECCEGGSEAFRGNNIANPQNNRGAGSTLFFYSVIKKNS